MRTTCVVDARMSAFFAVARSMCVQWVWFVWYESAVYGPWPQWLTSSGPSICQALNT